MVQQVSHRLIFVQMGLSRKSSRKYPWEEEVDPASGDRWTELMMGPLIGDTETAMLTAWPTNSAASVARPDRRGSRLVGLMPRIHL